MFKAYEMIFHTVSTEFRQKEFKCILMVSLQTYMRKLRGHGNLINKRMLIHVTLLPHDNSTALKACG